MFTGKTRKRKPSESEQSSPRPRNFKEDVENKQTTRRKLNNRHLSNKKKILEETNNSKQLREIEVRVEDCLQTNSALSLLCKQKLEEARPPSRPNSVLVDEEQCSNGSNADSVELVSVVANSDDVQCNDEEDDDDGPMPTERVNGGDGDDCNSVIVVTDRTSSSSERCRSVETSEDVETRDIGKPAQDQERDCLRGKDFSILT